MIYSTGYQAITVDQLKDLMDRYGITLIVDVRSVPYTRWTAKYQFNRNRMKAAFGPSYQWKGDILGGKQGPATEEGLAYLIALTETAVILCMEDDPRRCHRLTDISARLLPLGIEVMHLQGGRIFGTEQLLKEKIA